MEKFLEFIDKFLESQTTLLQFWWNAFVIVWHLSSSIVHISYEYLCCVTMGMRRVKTWTNTKTYHQIPTSSSTFSSLLCFSLSEASFFISPPNNNIAQTLTASTRQHHRTNTTMLIICSLWNYSIFFLLSTLALTANRKKLKFQKFMTWNEHFLSISLTSCDRRSMMLLGARLWAGIKARI